MCTRPDLFSMHRIPFRVLIVQAALTHLADLPDRMSWISWLRSFGIILLIQSEAINVRYRLDKYKSGPKLSSGAVGLGYG